MMDHFYQDTYPIDTRDMDLFSHCRPSALLGHLQEGATQAAAAMGLSHRESTEKYNAFWMLTYGLSVRSREYPSRSAPLCSGYAAFIRSRCV